MRERLEKILAKFAKKHLSKTDPEVIGITGSVGKSSAKEAVAAVLSNGFSVMASPSKL
jgi:UDP-N-acetylmuramyl pentapeptide synthase